MSWFLHLHVHLLLIALTLPPQTSFAFELGCRAYERCLDSMPDETIYRCEEIVDAWKDIYTCLSKARCNDDFYGAGLVIGRCLTLHNYYRRIRPQCGWDDRDPSFPDPDTFCGINTIPAFRKNFVNDTIQRSCGELFYPYNCDQENRMDHYIDCLWRGSRNRFTDGVVRGGCQHFTDDRGRKCSYDEDVCSGSVVLQYGAASLVLAVIVALGVNVFIG